ncbi:hypothetical protein DERP_002435 [Dermatophagoides pteronyssinus]|uniref:Uncharacterized protein n=1 Tax=Dermatophagoides pteronyssinus TaxID=6956 RepID=A0ABQ8JIC6_DERPT|nr:hypothetical protein DERP_002435 [Dermatophagoides pteronyssinus]
MILIDHHTLIVVDWMAGPYFLQYLSLRLLFEKPNIIIDWSIYRKSSCSALITGFGPSKNLRLNLDIGYSGIFLSSDNLFLNISINSLKSLRLFSLHSEVPTFFEEPKFCILYLQNLSIVLILFHFIFVPNHEGSVILSRLSEFLDLFVNFCCCCCCLDLCCCCDIGCSCRCGGLVISIISSSSSSESVGLLSSNCFRIRLSDCSDVDCLILDKALAFDSCDESFDEILDIC